MKSQIDATIDHLNHLIETCEDGRYGFDVASDDVKDPELRSLFQRYAEQRANLARELRNLVAQLGGKPERASSAPGKLHRGWINLKAALSSNEPHTVLVECERGEDTALKAYRDAVEKIDHPVAADVVRRQLSIVQSTHDSVRDLRDSPIYTKK